MRNRRSTLSVTETTTIVYLRVDTVKQGFEKNKNKIFDFIGLLNLREIAVVEDVSLREIPWKEREIGELLDSLCEGDNLIVTELTQIGYTMLEIMEILAVATQKKINVYAIKGNWKLNNTIQNKALETVFAMATEIEQDLISQRTEKAPQVRKKRGRPKGTGKSKLDKYQAEIEVLLNNGSTTKFIANLYQTTTANLRYWMKKKGLKRK